MSAKRARIDSKKFEAAVGRQSLRVGHTVLTKTIYCDRH